MCVLWRAGELLAVLLFFLSCDAQLRNEAQSGKLVYARGNHWAVGHLMGKKSIDETLGSDAQAYLITAETDALSRPSRLLKVLAKALAGTESETEDERERRERLMELRRRWEEHLAREREVSQAVRFLFLVSNTRDPNGI